ncbi:uncharacterized protein LOC135401079 [Ornithodoros turicata]|uniref:uncharacterized protein LOC135401079 n=1 Tax=Ornithodoros turicata TaxID=34597 RepID=UPI0031394E84
MDDGPHSDDEDSMAEMLDPNDASYVPNQTDGTLESSYFEAPLEEPDLLELPPNADTDEQPSYSAEDEDDENRFESIPDSKGPRENFYMVAESNLLDLLRICPTCLTDQTKVSLSCKGSLLRTSVTCKREHTKVWHSQPLLGAEPIGNVLMCAAILFAGCCPTKVLRMFDFPHLAIAGRTRS